MNSLEIIGNGSLEQIDRIVSSAKETGYTIIHIRNCLLAEDEIKAIKKKHNEISLHIESDEEHDVLCLANSIKKGAIITPELITTKKGQNGLTPKFADSIIGKKTLYDLPQGTTITFGFIEP